MSAKSILKSSRLTLLITLSLIVCAASLTRVQIWKTEAKSQTLKIGSAVTLEAKGRGGAVINFADGATIPTEYAGQIELSQSRPLTLAAADFDGDGVADLASGYATPGGGLLTIHRGNVESIFPRTAEIHPPPFFPEAKTLTALEQPDFLVAGDFNNDGRQDVVTARRDGDALNFFKGDGAGNLLSAGQIPLDGKITALAAGDLNREDSLDDLVVGTTGPNGAKVVIFEGPAGAFSGAETETFDLPNAATALAVVSFGELGFGDLAIAAGNELVFIHGRDRQMTLPKEERREIEPVVSRQSFGSKITALAAGKFTGGATDEIILLDESGSMHKAGSAAMRVEVNRLDLDNQLGGNELVKARVSASSATDDLILLDRENRKMHVLGGQDLRLRATFDGGDEITAAVPMRLNRDGLDDIVFLTRDKIAPSVAMTAPTAVFIVNSTGDEFDRDINDDICEIAPEGSGICTLRAAVQQANISAGADQIRFNLPGTAPFVITPANFGFGSFSETITFDGTTQPGFSGTPVVEIAGSGPGGGAILGANAHNSVVRGLALNRWSSGNVGVNSNNVRVEGNFIGTDITGTRGRSNGGPGITVQGSNHVIGGTTAAARNLVSGNTTQISVFGPNSTENQIIGNIIGTDVTGTTTLLDFGSNNFGINVTSNSAATIGLTIGGETPDKRNLISRNSLSGINVTGIHFTSNSSINIRNNFIGTDITGNIDLGNNGRGIFIERLNAGLLNIGGGANQFNLISGNTREGIRLERSTNVVIQSNVIGTRIDRTTPLLNDRHGILLADLSGGNLIGSSLITPGACDAGCNVIAFAAGFDGINVVNNNPTPLAPEVADGNTNTISGSQFIFGTLGVTDLPIDLGTDGRTPNDSGDGDSGPNRLQNFAEITSANGTGGSITAQGTLNSTPNTPFAIEFYLVRTVSSVSTATFVHNIERTTDGGGNAAFNIAFAAQTQTGDRLFAITTNRTTGEEDTSESSPLVTMSNCSFTVSPLTFSVPAAGGSRTVNITTQPACAWEASENETFIDVSSTSGTGNGSVDLTISPNTGAARNGTVTVAGQIVTVEQLAASCSFTVEPTSFNISAAQQNITVNVTTQPGCSWTAVSNDPAFITGNGGGTGSGSASFTVTQNSENARTGTLTVANQTVTVDQASGCQFNVNPLAFNVSPAGGSITVNVFTGFTCSWSGASNDAFIQGGGGNRTGPGSMNFTVLPNAGDARPGTVTVAGQTVTISQGTGQSCSFVVDPVVFNNVPHTSSSITVNVTTQPGCFWSGASNSNFITGGGNRIGGGSVNFTVATNNGLARTGTLTVAGQTVPVNQTSRCTYQVTGNPVSIGPEGGMPTIDILPSDPFCEWEATGSPPVVTVSPAGGTGTRTLTLNVQGNTGPDPRPRTITVADQTVAVNQAGCGYTLNPTALSFPAAASVRSFTLSAAPTCEWSASLSSNLTGSVIPAKGTGDNTIFVSLFSNPGNTLNGSVAVTGGGSVAIKQLAKGSNIDFDGDNRADPAIVGPVPSLADFGSRISDSADSSVDAELGFGFSSNPQSDSPQATVNWVINNSTNGTVRTDAFGLDTDKLVPGDFNGDGLGDLAVWRPSSGTWLIARPTGIPGQNFDAIPFGLPTDKPVPADYDGDGKTDIAVFRPADGDWWILQSTDNQVRAVHWGVSSDKPVPGDYDGDGQADIAVWRPSDRVWYVRQSSDNSFRFVQWGLSDDKPVPGDYDGDGKTDIAVFRPSDGDWYILQSSDNSLLVLNWGLATDVLVPADYDGDLKTDAAIWRPSSGIWCILRSSDGIPQFQQLGQNGDRPVPSALLPD